MDLDAPERTYLPEFGVADPEVSADVTVRNLLTHTGGWWGDSVTDTGDGPDAIARFVDEKMPGVSQLAPVGGHFTYNNSGLVLAGRIIEVVTGKTYREAMHGLQQSTFDPDAVLEVPHSEGHAATADGPPGATAAVHSAKRRAGRRAELNCRPPLEPGRTSGTDH